MNKYIQLFIIAFVFILIVLSFFLVKHTGDMTYQVNTNIIDNNVKKSDNIDNMNDISKTDDTFTQQAKVTTNYGVFTIEFFPELAPKTVSNFINLSKEGFYDGIRFHRIINDFVIQGGDPQTKDLSKENLWGTGGPGYQFEDEIHTKNNNLKYTLSMANSGPNTNGSQFFINVANNNFLDTKHTVFASVVSGKDVIDSITLVETKERDIPVSEVLIEKIEIIE